LVVDWYERYFPDPHLLLQFPSSLMCCEVSREEPDKDRRSIDISWACLTINRSDIKPMIWFYDIFVGIFISFFCMMKFSLTTHLQLNKDALRKITVVESLITTNTFIFFSFSRILFIYSVYDVVCITQHVEVTHSARLFLDIFFCSYDNKQKVFRLK
jgi:hypothetical protein